MKLSLKKLLISTILLEITILLILVLVCWLLNDFLNYWSTFFEIQFVVVALNFIEILYLWAIALETEEKKRFLKDKEKQNEETKPNNN